MEHKRMSRCGIDNCKQTHFVLENGRWFCRNGHMREGELEMAADDEGFGQTGARAGRAKVVTKRVHKVLRGRKGFELYLQCLQILLQKQVWWLIHSRGFPAELEVVVRDLWALRLQVVAATLPENVAPSSRPPSRAATDDGNSSTYLYTSDSDVASTTFSGKKRRMRRVPPASDRPKLIESLALCYLGLVLLRSAVSLGDFNRWADEGLVYIRAIRQVPVAMKEKLSAEYYTALEPMVRLRPGRLYRTVHEMVGTLHEKFGITFPPVNREVLLLRTVNDLGLPLEIYTATKRLADKLFMSFEWPALPVTKRATHWPELKLMALVITAIKLCYGLDNLPRSPHSPTEPAATTLDWSSWERFFRAGNAGRNGVLRGPEPGRNALLEVDVGEADVFGMDGEQMDWYLDWYEATWCDDERDDGAKTKLSQGILNLFPTSRTAIPATEQTQQQQQQQQQQQTLAERLSELHAATTLIPAVAEETEGVKRPGEQYLWYAFDEEVPHRLRTLMQAAADLLAVDRADLHKVVRYVEHALKEQVKEKRRVDRRVLVRNGEEMVDA